MGQFLPGVMGQLYPGGDTYKNICDEYDFLPEIFVQARAGDLSPLFKDDEARDTTFEILEHLTGVSNKYWSGDEGIKLGIRLSDIGLSEDGDSIDNVNIYPNYNDEEEFYKGHLENPLHLDFNILYEKVTKIKIEQDSVKENEHLVEIIPHLYSLRGLLTVLLVNMKDAEIIELIDKANIYKHSKWELYMRNLEEPTKEGITYVPRYVEIRKGLVQTIIKNLLSLGYLFTFRDLEKEFSL